VGADSLSWLFSADERSSEVTGHFWNLGTADNCAWFRRGRTSLGGAKILRRRRVPRKVCRRSPFIPCCSDGAALAAWRCWRGYTSSVLTTRVSISSPRSRQAPACSMVILTTLPPIIAARSAARVTRKMNRLQRNWGKMAEIAPEELASLLHRVNRIARATHLQGTPDR
jgi:hypothetical protein